MKKILDEIQSRQVRRGVDRRERGRPAELQARCSEEGKDHPIEQVGAELRAMMPWISAGKTQGRRRQRRSA